jgi:hypothetical protein
VRVSVPVLGAFSFAVVGSADGDQHTRFFFYHRIGIPFPVSRDKLSQRLGL